MLAAIGEDDFPLVLSWYGQLHTFCRFFGFFGPIAQWLEQRTFTGRRRGNPPLVRCKFGERPIRKDDPTPSQARTQVR